MFYVVTPEKPYPNDKLHHGTEFYAVAMWAKAEAARRRVALDVRKVSSEKIQASYGADGSNLPIRE